MIIKSSKLRSQLAKFFASSSVHKLKKGEHGLTKTELQDVKATEDFTISPALPFLVRLLFTGVITSIHRYTGLFTHLWLGTGAHSGAR
jgi:hypothetical protein